jgi:NADPH2:quinone reductase
LKKAKQIWSSGPSGLRDDGIEPPEESRDSSALNAKIDHVKTVVRDRSPRCIHVCARNGTMKALLCTRYGTPDDLTLATIDDPIAGAGEAVVRVEAAALNFFDTLIIAGKYQTKPAMPFSPAAEFAGTVESVGPGVTATKPGDRVLAYVGYGAAREKIVVKAEHLVPIPAALDADRAAGLAVTYGTTLHALKDRAHLKPGETLAVLGASGGVGLAAIEIGKLMSARVIACASSDDKLAFATAHGADHAINYAADDLKEALRRVTGGRGADVVYDPVGGPYAEPALRAIAWQGRYLVIGFAAGEIPKIPLNLALLKGCDIVGVFWGSFIERDPAGHRANMRQILDWAAAGKLSSHVHAVYPLSEAAAALKAIATRQVMGKVILRP